MRKNKIFRFIPAILLAALLFALCSRFSYYADDWFWGTDGRLSTFFDSFSNPDNPFHFYNNGRYFGNGLGFLCANHKLFRDLLMTVTLWGIIVLIAHISGRTAGNSSFERLILLGCAAGTVLLLCPKELFRESIGWSVAFTNYVVPSALCLLFLKMLFGQKTYDRLHIGFFLLPLLSAFFIENLTIGNAIFTVLWIVIRLICKQKPTRNEWLALAGSLAGLILMFSDDGYHQIMQGDPEQTYWGAQTGSIVLMIQTALKAFRNLIADWVVGRNILLISFGALSLMTAAILMRNTAKHRKLLTALTLMDTVIAVIFILWRASGIPEDFIPAVRTMEAVLALLYLLSLPVIILLLPYDAEQKEKLLFTWLYAAIITLPLTVAEPLSMRVFFPTYVFLLLLFCQIACINLNSLRDGLREAELSSSQFVREGSGTSVPVLGHIEPDPDKPAKRIQKTPEQVLLPYLVSIFLIGLGYLFGIYALISHYEQERIKYVKYQESIGEWDIDFPTLPLADHVIVSYPWGDVWQERYKKFNGLNLDTRFNIVSFDEWKAELQ